MQKNLSNAEVYALKLTFKDLMLAGNSQKESAKKVGISEVTASNWAKEMGLKNLIKTRFNTALNDEYLPSLGEFVAKVRVRYPNDFARLQQIITEISKPQ